MTSGKTDYKDIDELIESQNAKVQDLSLAMSIIGDRKHLDESIDKVFSLICNIKKNLTTLQQEKKRCVDFMSKIEEFNNITVKLDEKISNIENSLPRAVDNVVYMNNVQENDSIIQNEDIATPLTCSRRHLNFNDTIVTYSSQKHSMKQLGIMYLTVDEFQAIPSYMRGRVNYDTLKSFIDKFNTCLNDKYDFIAATKQEKSKKIPLKNHIKDRFVSYQRQETEETAGKKFITQDDLKSVMNGKIDKHSLNLLTMLRHTQRIRETRKGGVVNYILININTVQ